MAHFLLARQDPEMQFEMPPIPTDPAYYAWSVQPQLRAITLALLVLVIITILGRMYIRVFVLRVFRVDDFFILLATTLSVISSCLFLRVVQLGMGKHIFAVPPENTLPLLKLTYIFAVLIPLALCFVKLSVAFFLLSLTRGTQYGRFCWIMVGFLSVFTVFTFFTLIFGCVPIAANWDFNLRPPPMGKGNAKCLPMPAYKGIALANSITNIVTDVVLALMPVPLVWRLQVNRRTKISLMFILGLGFFACASGIIKTPLLYKFFKDMDSTGNSAWYYIWQIIEINVGILAAALPSLKPAFRWLLETARNIATGANSGRGTRTSVMSPGAGYKRQFSSGYLRQRDDNSNDLSNSSHTYNVSAVGPVTSKMDRSEKDPYALDALEMKPMYNVTVSGVGVASTTDDKHESADGAGYGGHGRRFNSSIDAIWKDVDVDGLGSVGTAVPMAEHQRGIVKKTEVTIVSDDRGF